MAVPSRRQSRGQGYGLRTNQSGASPPPRPLGLGQGQGPQTGGDITSPAASQSKDDFDEKSLGSDFMDDMGACEEEMGALEGAGKDHSERGSCGGRSANSGYVSMKTSAAAKEQPPPPSSNVRPAESQAVLNLSVEDNLSESYQRKPDGQA
ncbi:hypothetical protein ACOMHN_032942 [Nucella lapillus]